MRGKEVLSRRSASNSAKSVFPWCGNVKLFEDFYYLPLRVLRADNSDFTRRLREVVCTSSRTSRRNFRRREPVSELL